MFEGEDIKATTLSGKVEGLILFESTEAKMGDMVNKVMEKTLKVPA